jgi:hypothetical protein
MKDHSTPSVDHLPPTPHRQIRRATRQREQTNLRLCIYLHMTAATTPPIHVLRGILRYVKKTSPSSTTAPTASTAASNATSQPTTEHQSLHQHIISQYKASASVSPERANVLRGIAYDYWMLKADLVERARLHEIDAGADTKLSPMELSKRAAARAGLQLPKMDD